MSRIFLILASVYGKLEMDLENLKPRNRTQMAITACLGGFFGIHNFLLENDASGCIKIYLTLISLIAPRRIGLCLAAVVFFWILFDLWQICFVNTLPEIRFVGSRRKAAAFVFAYVLIVVTVVCFYLQRV